MAARIIHLGEDRHHRVPILKGAGYLVDNCSSIFDLSNLFGANNRLSAVVMAESNLSLIRNAVSITRSHCSAPIIFFPGTETAYSASEFDLIVPSFTYPQRWLADLARVIEWSSAVRSQSQSIQEKSLRLRRECIDLREKSRLERERSARERARMKRYLDTKPWKTE